MSKQLYEEALADVKKLKEIAEDNAKRSLIEAISPRIKDLIETLGVSQNTIYRMCDRNELQKLKFRGKCWFRTENVILYLSSKGILNTSECIKI